MAPTRPGYAIPAALALVAVAFTAVAVVDTDIPADPSRLEAPVDDDTVSVSVHAVNHTTVTSDADDVEIAITVMRPANASASDPVPVLLHGHGWGGEGWDAPGDDGGTPERFLDEGYGVVSIDQRGHGDSGGQARVMDPDHEAEDVKAVIDHVAGLDWVAKDDANDPVLGALGGSYGGGYQLVTALDETEETGQTRLDALAPEITWFDLAWSLAPDGVVKSEWADLLVAVAKAPPFTDTHPDYVDGPYAYTLATGDVPDDDTPGLPNVTEAYRNRSPVGFLERGVQIDVPALFQQGMTDTLFPLDQAVANREETLTPAARDASYVVGHTTGHVLPSLGPPRGLLQAPAGGDKPCTLEIAGGDGTDLLLAWFDHHLKGVDRSDDLPDHNYTLPTQDGSTCLGLDEVPDDGRVLPAAGPVVLTSGPAGPPTLVPIEEGPETIAGSPSVEATVSTGSVDTRFFVALAVGQTPADARVVDSQWRPVRLEGPVLQEDVEVDLPDVVAEVGPDEQVFLATTTSLDMYAHHGSRTPGPVVLEDVEVTLPTVS